MNGDMEQEQNRVRPMPGLNDITTQLSASWYVALRSEELKQKPVALKMFGQPLVAWRDKTGRAVVMERYCSHVGGNLADGRVVDGCIECPFHRWRYDSAGACVHVPGHCQEVPKLEPIPPTARQSIYATAERYGYVWVWYGTKVPLFPIPELPSADVGNKDYLNLKFSLDTKTSVLRIVENFYDAQHAEAVHRLPITAFKLSVLEDWRQSQDMEALARAGAWFGGNMEFQVNRYFGPIGMISRALGLNISKMQLHFDGYPGGCIMTVSLDDQVKYKLLQCVTPVDKNETVMHMLITMKKADGMLRNAANLIMFGLQTRQAAGYDVAIWNSLKTDGGGAFSKYDQLILKYRAFYRRWVNKVGQDQPGHEPEASVDSPEQQATA